MALPGKTSQSKISSIEKIIVIRDRRVPDLKNKSSMRKFKIGVIFTLLSVCVYVLFFLTKSDDFTENEKLQYCNKSINNKIIALEMVHIGQRYYYLSKSKKMWWKSKAECETRGLKLVSLNDEQQTQSLSQFLLDQHVNELEWTAFWTSGKEISMDQFEWTTQGDRFNITNWEHQFNNQRIFYSIRNTTKNKILFKGLCVEIERSGSNIRWKTINCHWRRRYICEMPVTCQFWLY